MADEGDVSATAAACCMYLLCPRPGQTGDIWESPVTTVKERWQPEESGDTLREGSLVAGVVDVG